MAAPEVSRRSSCSVEGEIRFGTLKEGDHHDLTLPGFPRTYELSELPAKVKSFVERWARICEPERLYVCNGSEEEFQALLNLQQKMGTLIALPKYENCWLARTNPADVSRMESCTFICTDRREQAVPSTRKTNRSTGIGSLGNWMPMNQYSEAIKQRFPRTMLGRTMFVIPFSMGPVGSPLARTGVELTDSPYVAASMRIMTRIGSLVMEFLRNNPDEPFVRCVHSVGRPISGIVEMPSWPCDPARTIVLHNPATNEIVSYGSGYGGNSLLGKKCFALRLGSTIGRREGWLAEHMLILGITNPHGRKRYIAAAFPSACGKTNLAMMTPTLPGYKIECVGDDIAWMRVDSSGQLRAINPEYGFFGVAPGTSMETNPNAMKTAFKNTVFTNVASTSDGGVFWEGLEHFLTPDIEVHDWRGRPWSPNSSSSTPAAHPNSRFCSPASQCPVIDSAWEDPEGVPISAILFGSRRPTGIPLVYEAYNWNHGIFIGASMRSEITAAAEHKGKVIVEDPFAMRPFFGYNFGHYLNHWLSMERRILANNGRLPKIFHVNWFLKDNITGKFLWPGYGENSRVLDWILRRVDDEPCFQNAPIGRIPKRGSINMNRIINNNNQTITNINFDALFTISKNFWIEECNSIDNYFSDNVGEDLPQVIANELKCLQLRVQALPPE